MALDPLSQEGLLVSRFCKEADRKENLNILQSALSGLESFIDYRAWSFTYKKDEAPKNPPAPASPSAEQIDRLSNLKPAPKDKQADILAALNRLKNMEK